MPDVNQTNSSQPESGGRRHENELLCKGVALGAVIALACVLRDHEAMNLENWSFSLKPPTGRLASWSEPVPLIDLVYNEHQASAMLRLPSQALATSQGISPLIQRSITDLTAGIRKEIEYRAQAERVGLTGFGPEKDASDSRHEKARLLLNASARLLMLQGSETPVQDHEWRMGTAAFHQALELYANAAQFHMSDR